MIKPIPLLLALLPLLAGCRVNRYRFQFQPSLNEVLVQPEASGRVIARALVSIQRGERREEDGWPEMLVGLRLENNDQAPIELLASELLLVDSKVETFGKVRITEGELGPIEAGASRKYELRFPYPEGLALSARELTGLNLRLGIRYQEGEAKATASFERIFIEPEGATSTSVHFGFFLSN